MKVLKKSNLFIFLFLLFTIFVTSNRVEALTINSTYADVVSTSTQVTNLINYAMSYDDFIDSDYVIFTDVQNSYYIVWSKDLSFNNNIVTGTNIKYIHYYRNSSNVYTYVYGTDSSFSLRSSYVNTSSLNNYGFTSSLFEEYKKSNMDQYFSILVTAFIFVIMLSSLRRLS